MSLVSCELSGYRLPQREPLNLCTNARGDIKRLGYISQGGHLARSVRTDREFAKRLRVAMEEAEVTPTALAEAQEVSTQTVSRWRRGELPDDLRFPSLAANLRVHANWLKTGQGEMNPLGVGNGQRVQESASAPYQTHAWDAWQRIDRALRLVRGELDIAAGRGESISPDRAKQLADLLAVAMTPSADVVQAFGESLAQAARELARHTRQPEPSPAASRSG